MPIKKVYFIVFFAICCFTAKAFHIVGGEIIYDYLGNSQYRITLKIYRDCSGNGADFDGLGNGGPCYLSIKNITNPLLDTTVTMGIPVVTQVPSSINNPCITAPNKCIQEGIYTNTITLNTNLYSYYLVYQRCCRNSVITNVLNIDQTGSTYYCMVPKLSTFGPNSSPRFTNLPPLFLCNKVNVNFNHSATDPDGDSLVYSFYDSYNGLDNCCPALNSSPQNCVSPPASCPTLAPSPPYQSTIFTSTFSALNPLPGNPAFAVNNSTGFLTGTPNALGVYLVSIAVKEYRNGVLIDVHYREYQLQILTCQISVVAAIGDFATQCFGNTANFINQSTNTSNSQSYFWDFGVGSATNDTSNVFAPTYVYQDTGSYEVTLIVNPGKFCTDTIKKQIKIYPPFDLELIKSKNQCLVNNSFSFAVTGTIMPQATFLWNFTPSATPISATSKTVSSVTYSNAGVYLVELKGSQFGCKDSVIDTIRVYQRPKAIIQNLPNSICNPGKVFFSNGSKSELPVKYDWSFSNEQSSQLENPIMEFNGVGTYTVKLTVTTTSICADTSNAIYLVNVVPSPTAGFKATPSVTTIFDPNIYFENKSTTDAIYFNYKFDDGNENTNPYCNHIYETYGTYYVTLTVSNNYGCSSAVTEPVIINPEFRFWVPNAFTTDNNGLNDVFLPICVGTEEYVFQIFDRWGEKLFETKDYKQGWNGKFKGELCKQDIYVWRAEYINAVTKRKEVKYGHVTLIKDL